MAEVIAIDRIPEGGQPARDDEAAEELASKFRDFCGLGTEYRLEEKPIILFRFQPIIVIDRLRSENE